MIELLLTILVLVLVFLILAYIVHLLVSTLGLPAPIGQVVLLILALIFLLYFLSAIGVRPPTL